MINSVPIDKVTAYRKLSDRIGSWMSGSVPWDGISEYE
jgi:hypothetical protein